MVWNDLTSPENRLRGLSEGYRKELNKLFENSLEGNLMDYSVLSWVVFGDEHTQEV